MIRLKIYTPQGSLIKNDNVKSITLPTASGVITVLEDHQPLISLLSFGEVEIVDSKGDKEYVVISSGILRVENESNISIMVDTSELASEIDVKSAQRAYEKAQEYLKNNKDISDVEFAKVQGSIERELARIEIAKLRNRKKDDIKVNVVRK